MSVIPSQLWNLSACGRKCTACSFPKTRKRKQPRSFVSKYIRHNEYANCLFDEETTNAKFRNIRSIKHQLHTTEISKIALSPYDDKRYLVDNCKSPAYGHYKTTDNKSLSLNAMISLATQFHCMQAYIVSKCVNSFVQAIALKFCWLLCVNIIVVYRATCENMTVSLYNYVNSYLICFLLFPPLCPGRRAGALPQKIFSPYILVERLLHVDKCVSEIFESFIAYGVNRFV